MTWQSPVPNAVISRGFGPTSRSADEGAYADLKQGIAHDYGARSFPGSQWYPDFHTALDLVAPEGTPIYAPQGGVVVDSQWGTVGSWAYGGGNFVRVLVNPTCMYLVAHCKTRYVSVGDRVSKGARIAAVGQTGVASGPHCHFWVRLGPQPYYDPRAFFFDPKLILPGGRLANDQRFSPPMLPNTTAGGPPVRCIPIFDKRGVFRGDKGQVEIRKAPTLAGAPWFHAAYPTTVRVSLQVPGDTKYGTEVWYAYWIANRNTSDPYDGTWAYVHSGEMVLYDIEP
jgi:hypothetical protein